MAAKQYHFCQHCKSLVSPSINDDRLKERDQVADYNKYVDKVASKWILACACPKCGAAWKPALLYIGSQSARKAARVRRVKNELLSPSDRRARPGLFGFVNYKKLQQANGRAKS